MDEALLARHGESTYNVRGACNGDPSRDVRLTAIGRLQARRLGEEVAALPLELCLTSSFPRTRETADLALAGREVSRLVVAELDDPRLGALEGCSLEEFRAFTRGHDPDEPLPGGGESRADVVRRYVVAFRALLERSERLVLVVAHGLPIHYAVEAARGITPAPAIEVSAHASVVPFCRNELERAVELLARWCEAPAW